MNDEILCEGCGKTYYEAGEWQHAKCGVDVRTGKLLGSVKSRNEEVEGTSTGTSVDKDSLGPKQRWDRTKYNTYMRENRHRWKK